MKKKAKKAGKVKSVLAWAIADEEGILPGEVYASRSSANFWNKAEPGDTSVIRVRIVPIPPKQKGKR